MVVVDGSVVSQERHLGVCKYCPNPIASQKWGLCRKCDAARRQHKRRNPDVEWIPVGRGRPKGAWGKNAKHDVLSLSHSKLTTPDAYKAEMGFAGWAADLHGDLTRLPPRAKAKHVLRDSESSNSASDNTPVGRWDQGWRKNQKKTFQSVHCAERDRALWLRSQGLPAPKVLRSAHVPTCPGTWHPTGWGKSGGYGNVTSYAKWDARTPDAGPTAAPAPKRMMKFKLSRTGDPADRRTERPVW